MTASFARACSSKPISASSTSRTLSTAAATSDVVRCKMLVVAISTPAEITARAPTTTIESEKVLRRLRQELGRLFIIVQSDWIAGCCARGHAPCEATFKPSDNDGLRHCSRGLQESPRILQ
ncbi:MAG: hypothetical protein M3619_00075 [Myxococcota bacterium]|nr:hypothetical protein [Myxococcota bacterium]